MNFDDEDGPQRPIGGRDSLDRKIAAIPSPYALAKKKTRNRRTAGTEAAAVTINDADVLCGRGRTSFNHPGNKRFRDLITNAIPGYNRSDSRLEKSIVVQAIVESIRGPGGRFLKTDQASGQWKELDERASREKVGHAVRDAATTTQTRRAKKKQLQSHFGGGTATGYTEMKLDDPSDPLTFHDIAHFSNLMSGSSPSRETPRPLIEPNVEHQDLNMPLPAGTQQGAANNARDETGTAEQEDEHHQDEVGFMAHIDQVLGQMDPDQDIDPLAELLDLS